MAKPLVLSFGDSQIPFTLTRVERSDLYGFVEIEALDDNGRRCTMATLAEGQNVIGSGGVALVMLTPEGNWIDKKALTPADSQGKRIEPVPSSYSAPVPLEKKVSIDEYLSHNIRAVYQVSSDVDFGLLMDELKKGTIFQFPYSFRGGLEPDAGFLLLNAEGIPFIAIGSPTKLEFVGLAQSAAVAEEETTEEEEEALDFSMM